MARKLKVFCWSDGFHAFTVAAPSRKAALQAWGFERDLFKDGSAREVDQGPDHDAALARPGELIERGLSVDVGKAAPVSNRRKPKGPSAADRKRVAALEARLETLDAEQAEAREALNRRLEALQKEGEQLDAAQDKTRRELVAKLKAAREKL